MRCVFIITFLIFSELSGLHCDSHISRSQRDIFDTFLGWFRKTSTEKIISEKDNTTTSAPSQNSTESMFFPSVGPVDTESVFNVHITTTAHSLHAKDDIYDTTLTSSSSTPDSMSRNATSNGTETDSVTTENSDIEAVYREEENSRLENKTACELIVAKFVQSSGPTGMMPISLFSVALSHHLILKRIFVFLSVRDLLQLSFVNKIWCSAARSTLRYKKRCVAGNKGGNPCQELLRLNILLAASDDPPFSGLAIRTCLPREDEGYRSDKKPPMMIKESEKNHSYSFKDTSDLTSETHVTQKRYSDHKDCLCATVSEIYPALLGKLFYRHVEIHWESKISCPAQSLLIKVLKEKAGTLEELKVTAFPPRIESLKNGLRIEESFWLPKLQLLDLSQIQTNYISPSDTDDKPTETRYQECLKHDILKAAQNVRIQLGFNRIDDLDFFLEHNKVPILKHFFITCSDVFGEEKDNLLRFIDANPKLTKVVIASKCLENILLDEKHLLLLLPHVLTEPLAKLTHLDLELIRDHTDLRDFPTLQIFDWGSWFPNLKIVNVIGTITSNRNSITWEELQYGLVSSSCPSVNEVNFMHKCDCSFYDFESLSFFGNVFPHLTRISVHNIKADLDRILKFLWSGCPKSVQSISLTSLEDFIRNFDSIFCGITPKQANLYRLYSSKQLKKLKLTPVEPSILLLKKLKKFRVEIPSHPAWVRCDKYAKNERKSFFVTHVTGLLAFDQMNGLKVEIVRPVCSKQNCGYALEHLRGFVTLIDGSILPAEQE
ncbi:unnamed protein product [Allacma fusca]|uniref:F-box domain-containing protein n=1 Tax=Allacma fusca TaxID=39272 RepID=A0A8J2JVY7_9HEXA|nr:unnamed protein product [Allacma fusca]